MDRQPSLPAKNDAFQLWMDHNAPDLKVYAKVFADKFQERLNGGANAFRQIEMFTENGVPKSTSREMVSALLRIFVTGHIR